MARKNKEDAPNPNSVPNRDILQRLNFLYQASSYLNSLGAAHAQAGPSNVSKEPTQKERASIESGRVKEKVNVDAEEKSMKGNDTRKRAGQRKATAHDLARSYVKSMRIIGQKTNVKMDPTVKRTLCKGCNTLLMPGVTAKVRVKPLPSHGQAVIYTCTNCSFSRRIPAPPTIQPSSQPSESSTKSPEHMDIDPVDSLLETVEEEVAAGTAGRVKPENKRRKRKPVKPRALPFFERADHILFVGNERVDRNSEEDGLP